MSIEATEAGSQVSRAMEDKEREIRKESRSAINELLSSGRKVWVILALALVPWVLVAALAAGVWVAFNLITYAILAMLVGYAVVSAALPSKARRYAVALAPSAGILTLSALTAFWLRLGLPLVWVSIVWLALAAFGTITAWQDRNELRTTTVEYGMAVVLLSALICGLYFVPGAFNDGVVRRDGSFTWFSIDTQLYHSMVASIKNSDGRPKMAGTSTADLCYHFGPYSLAAGISKLTGVSTGDALVRLTRGVEQWALVFSCLGLGTLLSLTATGKKFGGILSVAAVFFYGSFLSLFSGIVRPRPVAPWPVIFEAGGQFPTNAGIFSHILLGTSMLHGIEAVTAIMGLCIAQRALEGISRWRLLVTMILPAFMATVHSAGGLYCLGVVAVLLFWGRLDSADSWLLMALMAGLFWAACRLMGYDHAPHVAGAGIRLSQLPLYWWTFVMWFVVGLGIRVTSFAWVAQKLRSPLAMLVIVSFAGLLAFSWVGALWSDTEHYGVYYLQAIFGIFAFSRLLPGFWRAGSRDEWVTEWLSLVRTGLFLFLIAGICIGFVGYAVNHAAGISYFRSRVVVCLLMLAFLTFLLLVVKRSPRFSPAVSATLAFVLLFSFFAWIPPWLKYRTAGQPYNVTLTSGEMHGLQRLSKAALPGERFATNKHLPTGGAIEGSADSYAYATISGRPVLLEGSYDGAEETLPSFPTLLRDNDLLFSTTNSQVLRDVAQSYRVRWLVLRPGTDISLSKPLPPWLVEEPDSGSLKIYRIN